MHKITFIQVGKTKDRYIDEGVAEFAKRLSRYADLEILTVTEGKFLNTSMIEREKKEESLRIKHLIHDKEGYLFYLDVAGRSFSSEEFSGILQDYIYEGTHIYFLIGGAYGIDEEVLGTYIKMRISLSKMTFTHQLVRLLFFEQLYRAFSIMRGSEYHH